MSHRGGMFPIVAKGGRMRSYAKSEERGECRPCSPPPLPHCLKQIKVLFGVVGYVVDPVEFRVKTKVNRLISF